MADSELLRRLHATLRPRTYLQLGSRQPEHIAQASCGTVVVDPNPKLPLNVVLTRPWLKLYAIERETFFADERCDDVLDNERIDLALIEQVDSLDQLARDLRHIEAWSHERTCAVVLGNGAASADPEADLFRQFAVLARQRRPSLDVRLVAAEPHPLLLVSGFDPAHPGDDIREAQPRKETWKDTPARIDPVPLEKALPAFALKPVPVDITFDPGDWEAWTSLGGVVRPRASGGGRLPSLVLERPFRGAFRVELEIAAGGMNVLRLRCRGHGPGGVTYRDVLLDVGSPGALHHQLDRVALDPPSGEAGFRLDLEGMTAPGETLHNIVFSIADHWNNDLPTAPNMALEVRKVRAWEISAHRGRAPFAPSRRADRSPADKRARGRRDAVVFAWYIPEQMGQLGEYYLNLLRFHHPDSKLFVGMNHGSDPRWVDHLLHSGLDVDVRQARHQIGDYWDATGFLTALEGLDHSDESFDLVWFGHAKGGSQRTYEYYQGIRFLVDRTFWSRREAVEQAFSDPKIGMFAARYNLYPTYPWEHDLPGWDDELNALSRIYRERYAPLGLNAYETFFTLRHDVVRRFLDGVGSEWVLTDPKEWGGGRWFFEMAFPSIASMQGYEPFIPMDVLGAGDPRDDLNMTYDMKQNHRLALAELERWRENPYDFTPRVVHWDHRAWNRVRGI
jgi:hypothetical protein